MTEPRTPLSPAGERRREQILEMAIRGSRRRRHRRIIVRAALACIALALALPVLVHLGRTHRPTPLVIHSIEHHDSPPQARRPAPRVERQIAVIRIATDPDLARRLSIPTSRVQWQKIGDDELLEQLGKAGRPAGLASVAGRQMLLFRHEP